MTQPVDPDGDTPEDRALEAQLRVAAQRFDPVPDAVRAGAMSAFAWRDLDAALELLTVEAAEPDLAGVRTTALGRFLTLSSERLVVELEVFPSDGPSGEVKLRGLALLAPVTTVELRSADGSTPVTAAIDGAGRFTVDGVPPGAARLVFGDADGPRYASEWLTL